jgi:CelD/BcsL family acetyltransferase involved in cellulose biosynthesis
MLVDTARRDGAAAIRRLAPEWDDLADRAGSGPFSRPGWFEAWWDAFGRGRLEVVTVRRGTRLAAVLPLHVRGGVRRSLTNWHTPELVVPAEDDRARAELLHGVLRHARLPLALGMLTGGQPDPPAVRAAARATGSRVLERTIERSPYVELTGDWAGYEAALPRRRRSELRRRRRRLEEQGSLAFEVADGTERLEALLAEGFAAETSGWKAETGTAIASHPQTLAFYTSLARWASARGILRLAFLRLDRRPIAFHLTIEEGGSAYQLKGGYDPSLRALAPGALLIRQMLEWAYGRGLRTYEFLGADEDFKLDWTSDLRDRLMVQAFPRSAPGAVGFAAYAYGRPMVKRARDLARR